MEIPAHQREPIIEGLAAIAVTVAEMDGTEDDMRQQVVGKLVQLRIDEADVIEVLREAAAAISRFPQPVDDPADRLERGRRIREMLGLPEPAEELAATLRAREWLQRLADEIERHIES